MSDTEQIKLIIPKLQDWLIKKQISPVTIPVYLSAVRAGLRAGADLSQEKLEAHYASLNLGQRGSFRSAWRHLVDLAKANNFPLPQLTYGKRGPKAAPKPEPSNVARAAAVIYEVYKGKLDELVMLTIDISLGTPEMQAQREVIVNTAYRHLIWHFYPGRPKIPGYSWLFPKEPNSDVRMSKEELHALVESSGFKLSQLRKGYFLDRVQIISAATGEKEIASTYQAERLVASGKASWPSAIDDLSAHKAYLARRALLAETFGPRNLVTEEVQRKLDRLKAISDEGMKVARGSASTLPLVGPPVELSVPTPSAPTPVPPLETTPVPGPMPDTNDEHTPVPTPENGEGT